MRNRLIHGRFDIDTTIVWEALSDELPPVLASPRAVRRTEDPTEPSLGPDVAAGRKQMCPEATWGKDLPQASSGATATAVSTVSKARRAAWSRACPSDSDSSSRGRRSSSVSARPPQAPIP